MRTFIKIHNVISAIVMLQAVVILSGCVAMKPATLVEAAKKGDVATVNKALAAGIDINAKDEQFKGDTALIAAAGYGRTEVARLLIEKGADVNARDKNGYTALIKAASSGHIDIVKMLIEKGADVNAISGKSRMTALCAAAEDDRSDIVNLLIAKGAKCQTLDEAVILGDVTSAKKYLASRSDAKSKDGLRRPLVYAVDKGHIDIAKLLIEQGVNVNTYGSDGSMLMIAAGKGNMEMVKLLIEKGGKSN